MGVTNRHRGCRRRRSPVRWRCSSRSAVGAAAPVPRPLRPMCPPGAHDLPPVVGGGQPGNPVPPGVGTPPATRTRQPVGPRASWARPRTLPRSRVGPRSTAGGSRRRHRLRLGLDRGRGPLLRLHRHPGGHRPVAGVHRHQRGLRRPAGAAAGGGVAAVQRRHEDAPRPHRGQRRQPVGVRRRRHRGVPAHPEDPPAGHLRRGRRHPGPARRSQRVVQLHDPRADPRHDPRPRHHRGHLRVPRRPGHRAGHRASTSASACSRIAIAIAIGCLLFSRIFDVAPGVLYGLFAGVLFVGVDSKLAGRAYARSSVLLGSAAMLAWGLHRWIGGAVERRLPESLGDHLRHRCRRALRRWAPVGDRAAAPDAVHLRRVRHRLEQGRLGLALRRRPGPLHAVRGAAEPRQRHLVEPLVRRSRSSWSPSGSGATAPSGAGPTARRRRRPRPAPTRP